MDRKTYSYGLPDGTYTGRPTTASCFSKDDRLILDVRFCVVDPKTGVPFVNQKGYDLEVLKRFWLTSKDGAFNEATIANLKEWAKGWNPSSFDDFYWFQREKDGASFGNLAAIGDVELNFTTDPDGNQQLWVHDPNRPRKGRAAYVPEGAIADSAALSAKWGAKAKALFAATPKKIAVAPTPAPAATPAPVPAPVPSRPAASAPTDKPWANYPQTANGAFQYFCAMLPEPYVSAKHDVLWFECIDKVANGKDVDEFSPIDVQSLFKTINDKFGAPF